jgi:DNA-binding XRE family transcriptional regulator
MSNLMENNNFARVLRAERKRLQLTQVQLAQAIGTSQQNIGGMERGLSLPRPELHDKMVELFGQHSPVANLPPRRDVLIPGPSAEVIRRASQPLPSDRKPEPIESVGPHAYEGERFAYWLGKIENRDIRDRARDAAMQILYSAHDGMWPSPPEPPIPAPRQANKKPPYEPQDR